MNCTQPPEEIRALFGMDLPTITAAAAAAPPGCRGVNMLPYLAGERTPDWPHARGALLGLTPGALQDPGLLYRAALEGSTFSLAAGIDLCALHAFVLHACVCLDAAGCGLLPVS